MTTLTALEAYCNDVVNDQAVGRDLGLLADCSSTPVSVVPSGFASMVPTGSRSMKSR
jgi:hypothetical protein